jgi:hypothetical protein
MEMSDEYRQFIMDNDCNFESCRVGLNKGAKFRLFDTLTLHKLEWKALQTKFSRVTIAAWSNYGYHGMNAAQVIMLSMIGKMAYVHDDLPDNLHKLLNKLKLPPSRQDKFDDVRDFLLQRIFNVYIPSTAWLGKIYDTVFQDLCKRVSDTKMVLGNELLTAFSQFSKIEEAELFAKWLCINPENMDDYKPSDELKELAQSCVGDKKCANLTFGPNSITEFKTDEKKGQIYSSYKIMQQFEMGDFKIIQRLFVESQLLLKMYDLIQMNNDESNEQRIFKDLFAGVTLLKIKGLTDRDVMYELFGCPRAKAQPKNYAHFINFSMLITNEDRSHSVELEEVTLPLHAFGYIFASAITQEELRAQLAQPV